MSDPVMGNLAQSGPSRQGAETSRERPDESLAGLPLTALEPSAQAKGILKLWFDQEPFYKRLRALWKVNALRRAGQTGIYLLKRTDTQEWQAYAPPGTSKQAPSLNKAARLCRLLRAIMFTDPPEPEATPSSDADEDRDSAEFSTRALIDLGNEGNLDNAHGAEQAFDHASTYGSGYRRYYVEPQGGGKRPWDVQAAATATTYNPQDPASALNGPDGQVAPAPYVRKWVRADFSLTDDPKDPTIQRVWVPKLCREVLKAPNVRFLPATAQDIWEARGALIGSWVTLDDLRSRFPDKIPTDPEGLKKLTEYRPPEAHELLPGGKSTKQTVTTDQSKAPSGDTLVFTVTCYYTQGPTYDQGYYGVAAGTDLLLHTGLWYNEKKGEPLDIPLDQFKQVDDESSGHGLGLMTFLGPGNEIRASTLGGMQEHQDRFLNRKVFVPHHSPFQPRSAQSMTGTYIPIPIGGKPEVEQVPDFPKAIMDMFSLISAELDHEAGLEPPVSGQNPPSVESGLHARTIIEQVNVGLSDLRNNVIRGLIRGWRIQLQLAAKELTVPMQIGWVGDDGSFKQQEWTGSDLGNTKDVMLHKGTLSMLSPSAKLSVAEQMGAMQVGQEPLLTAEELRRIVIGNVGGLLGLQDDPRRQRVQRQIYDWSRGPAKNGVQPAAASPLELAGQPVAQPGMAVQSGVAPQPGIAPAPLPPNPKAVEIWTPIVVDDQPDVATIRVNELSRLLNSTKYSRWPADWRAPVDQEYLRMRYAAGIHTVAEQAAAQQAAQQAQQQQGQDAMAQVQPAIQQTQAQVQQLAAEVKAQMGELQKVVKGVDQEITTLAKAVANVTDDTETLASGIDQQLAAQQTRLEQTVKQDLRAAEQRLVKLAQTLKPGTPPVPPAAAPSVTHVHLPPAGPEEAEFEVTSRDPQGRAATVKKKSKRKGGPAAPEPKAGLSGTPPAPPPGPPPAGKV